MLPQPKLVVDSTEISRWLNQNYELIQRMSQPKLDVVSTELEVETIKISG